MYKIFFFEKIASSRGSFEPPELYMAQPMREENGFLLCQKSVKSTQQSCLHLNPSKKKKKRAFCSSHFVKLNQGEKMHHLSPVCTSPKLLAHSGPILHQIGLTRSQKPSDLASQGIP